MSHYIHQVHGRIRVRLCNDETGDGRVPAALAAIAELPGVQSVKFRPKTGSLVVQYDTEFHHGPAVIGILSEMRLLPGILPFPTPSPAPLAMARPVAVQTATAVAAVDWKPIAVRVAKEVALFALPLVAERFLGRGAKIWVNRILR